MAVHGIFPPIGGLKEDVTTMLLSESFSPESCNVELFESLARKVLGRRAIFSACAEDIQSYHSYIDDSGGSHLFAFAAGAIYKYNYVSCVWDNWLDTTSIASVTPAGAIWSIVDYQGKIYASNQNKIYCGDSVNKFDVITFDYGDTTTITACEFLAAFENRLWLCGVTVSGSVERQLVYFSGVDLDENDFADFYKSDECESGYLFVDSTGTLIGAGDYQDYLVLFTGTMHFKVWWVGGDDIFNIARVNNSVGLVNCNALCSGVDGQLYYFSYDGSIRELLGGRISQSISQTLRSISTTNYDKIRAFLHPQNNQIWFSIPADGADSNNTTVCYDPESESWHIRKYGVSCYGLAHENTEISDYTWATLPFDSWDDWDWDSWDSIENDPGAILKVIGADGTDSFIIDGSVNDINEPLAGWLVLATSMNKVGEYKRISNLTTYFKPDLGSNVSISISVDGKPYTDITELVLGGSGEYDITDIPVDLRGRQFKVKISGDDYWRFVGILFDYSLDGTR